MVFPSPLMVLKKGSGVNRLFQDLRQHASENPFRSDKLRHEYSNGGTGNFYANCSQQKAAESNNSRDYTGSYFPAVIPFLILCMLLAVLGFVTLKDDQLGKGS
jgi:hypothetical protein